MSLGAKAVNARQTSDQPRMVLVQATAQSPERDPVIRQDRIQNTDGCQLVIDGRAFQILDFSPFGVAIRTGGDFAPFGELQGVSFQLDGVELASLQIRAVREEALNAGGFKIGFSITGEPLSVEKVMGIQEARRIRASVSEMMAAEELIPPSFRRLTLEIKDILEQVERQVKELEARFQSDYLYPDELEALEGSVIQVIGDFIEGSVDPKVGELPATLEGLESGELKAAYEFFRAKVGTLIYQAPFSRRSYVKPLGYAGDYEMMNMVYCNEGLGTSLFARCLQHYFINMPGGKAVRNRGVYLNHKINQLLAGQSQSAPIRVLSVASGPAMEVQMLFKQDPAPDLSQVEFHLLDQDIHSLKHAQRRIRELSQKAGRPCQLKLHHNTIKRVITEGLEEDNYDLIYSAGLFDYFSEPVAHMAARRLFNAVKPGGQLIIGNFNVTSPSRFFMEMAWNWNLIYRSEEDLIRMGQQLKGEVRIEQEQQGINLFCVVRKDGEN